ncbi:bifunctional diguanylate cyclase/phosphodiesterase [Sporomusa sp.]|uniref:putative bifunctional diguanylate cyclase/phosphodiesterase n=1 Tax=Sporomusa sp. TaxID=2078658 RepID=UPI002BCD09B7|nr:bifunctional diguanylate cyclase/phosphodiesterase [Sporomusa sp.]HWR42564.1 bifunctional diguanylate cyclase/phosphodiesterase [Sporomusa sp.]
MRLLAMIQSNPLRILALYITILVFFQIKIVPDSLSLSTIITSVMVFPPAFIFFFAYSKLQHELAEEKKTAERAHYLAFHDSITGMPNRNYFQGTLTELLAVKKQRVGVMMIDLHGFSLINDIAGHQEGYKLLKDVAKRLIQNIPENCMIANVWGDKFLLAIPGMVDPVQLTGLAENILSACRLPWLVDSRQFFLTANIGICVSPEDGKDAITLMKNADMAVSRAKAQGKNQYKFYTLNFSSNALKNIEMETKLRNALENDEFFIAYQPRVSLSTGEINSVEALLRWQNKELGLVSPGEFIPLAEATGLIDSIGEWVLITVCRQIKSWSERGFTLPVSINLSVRQFYQQNLVESIARTLNETQVEPAQLELEITESMIMQDVNQAIITIKELRSMGVSIAIDDFGTGHSSLTNLKVLPVDVLKIDKKFVQDAEDSPESRSIVQAIITLGHILGLTVTAEGVETELQLSMLREMGCNEVQGYFFSQPTSPERIYTMLVGGNEQAKILKNQLAIDSSCL